MSKTTAGRERVSLQGHFLSTAVAGRYIDIMRPAEKDRIALTCSSIDMRKLFVAEDASKTVYSVAQNEPFHALVASENQRCNIMNRNSISKVA